MPANGLLEDSSLRGSGYIRNAEDDPLSKMLNWQDKHIADAAFRADDAWRVGVGLELSPQPKNLDIDAAVEHVFVNTRSLQQMHRRHLHTTWTVPQDIGLSLTPCGNGAGVTATGV